MRKAARKKHSSGGFVRRQGIRAIKQSFLIVCEGECTEPDYFNAFRLTTATVRTVGQAMNTISLVHKAISIRDADKLKRKRYDQCWVVFDKDDFPAKDFNQAIQLAECSGFKVAYSNQSFEFWFLLHFNPYRGRIHRTAYTDMLSRLLGVDYCKKEGFASDIYKRLSSRQSQAIKNAEIVLEEISAGNPAAEESSTTVHRLVSELNKYL